MKANKSLLSGLIIGVLLVGVAGFLYLPIKTKQIEAEAASRFEQRLAVLQAEWMAPDRKAQHDGLIGNLLDQLDDELKDNPSRLLTEVAIARAAALSHLLKPYTNVENGKLTEYTSSPERGQLLISLLKMNIDTASLYSIYKSASFAFADLRAVNLHGAYLRSADLEAAHMQDINLSGANLNEANLYMANLWGADLKKTTFNGANLKRADMSRADMQDVQITLADMDGINLTSADLRRARLTQSTMHWANLNGTFFNDADLTKLDMLGAKLERTHFEAANLSGVNFLKTTVLETNMAGADLTGAFAHNETWFTSLKESAVIGIDDIQSNYKIVADSTGKYIKYLIVKINQ